MTLGFFIELCAVHSWSEQKVAAYFAYDAASLAHTHTHVKCHRLHVHSATLVVCLNIHI